MKISEKLPWKFVCRLQTWRLPRKAGRSRIPSSPPSSLEHYLMLLEYDVSPIICLRIKISYIYWVWILICQYEFNDTNISMFWLFYGARKSVFHGHRSTFFQGILHDRPAPPFPATGISQSCNQWCVYREGVGEECAAWQGWTIVLDISFFPRAWHITIM